jgi:parvulin-like peptidyl-prolyl isomerase
MGWQVQGAKDQAVEAAAFALQPGEMTSEPVQVGQKWYIYRADKREVRELEESALTTLQSKAFRDYLEAKKLEIQISRFITSEKQLWAQDQVTKARERRLRRAS